MACCTMVQNTSIKVHMKPPPFPVLELDGLQLQLALRARGQVMCAVDYIDHFLYHIYISDILLISLGFHTAMLAELRSESCKFK